MDDNNANGAETIIVDIDLKDLIPAFMENRQADITALQENLSQGNYEKIKEIGHILKGSGGGYGFDEISRIGADLEKGAGAADEKLLEELIAELKEYLERIIVVFE